MEPRGVSVPSVITVVVATAMMLSACTATSDATPSGSATAASSRMPTATEPTANAGPAEAPLTAGQARKLLPLEYYDDPALAAFGAQEASSAPFDLTTVGDAVSDAHLNQSAEPAACGIVDGVWYGSAGDRDVTDSLLEIGVASTTTPNDTIANENVRVFPSEADAESHLAVLSDALPSCAAFTVTDTQAGGFAVTVTDMSIGDGMLGYTLHSTGSSDDGSAAGMRTVRMERVRNTLVSVDGSDAEVVDELDRFVDLRIADVFPD